MVWFLSFVSTRSIELQLDVHNYRTIFLFPESFRSHSRTWIYFLMVGRICSTPYPRGLFCHRFENEGCIRFFSFTTIDCYVLLFMFLSFLMSRFTPYPAKPIRLVLFVSYIIDRFCFLFSNFFSSLFLGVLFFIFLGLLRCCYQFWFQFGLCTDCIGWLSSWYRRSMAPRWP